mmetsp:Transcript_22520/g.54931  ORF Transcript_22520/g.54931 Transcript_22520/m.54931 type:complete len:266 (+) Transcript_22520:472-1269(+)
MLSRLPSSVEKTFRISEGFYCTVQFAAVVATFTTNTTAINSIRHLATCFVVAFVACILILSSFRLRNVIQEAYPEIAGVSLSDLESDKPITKRNKQSFESSKKNSSESVQIKSILEVKVKSSTDIGDSGQQNSPLPQSPRSPRSNKQHQKDTSGSVPHKIVKKTNIRHGAKILRTAIQVRKKLEKLLIFCPIILILGCGVLIYLFVNQITNSASYSEDYRSEKSNFNLTVDISHYFGIVVIMFFEWYSNVTLAQWVYDPFLQCCQ